MTNATSPLDIIKDLDIKDNPQVSFHKPAERSLGDYQSTIDWWNLRDLDQSNKIKASVIIDDVLLRLMMNAPNRTPVTFTPNLSTASRADANTFCSGDKLIYRQIYPSNILDNEKMLSRIDSFVVRIQELKDLNPQAIVDAKWLRPFKLDSFNDIEGFNDFLATLGYDKISVVEHDALGKMIGKKIRDQIYGIVSNTESATNIGTSAVPVVMGTLAALIGAALTATLGKASNVRVGDVLSEPNNEIVEEVMEQVIHHEDIEQ